MCLEKIALVDSWHRMKVFVRGNLINFKYISLSARDIDGKAEIYFWLCKIAIE